ncbi:MAG: transposase [Deltaproteobacteria bacterium]|nr:transposase [Deltaproteobacteria bacterium]
MTDYRRPFMPGAAWFFTVNLAERNGNRLLIEKLDNLRSAFRSVQADHHFRIDAVVILPEHLHCIWTLPPGDSDFATRWGLIKGQFSRSIQKGERVSPSRFTRGERGIWQRRFWEHLIRDETDFRRHVDYIHWNPVKHGWAQRAADWPHSSFHSFVRRRVYTED